MVSFDNINEKSLKKLKKYGFDFVKIKSKHENVRLKGMSNLVLYKTGKLLVQGSKSNVEETVKLINFLGITKAKKKFSGIAIGSDETLKGDTFGGIVVAAFKANDKLREELKDLGVKDCKAMLKPDCVKMANKLIDKYPKNFHVENIYPKEYNNLNNKNNVTEILDMLHKKCYKKLARSKKIIHIIDLYPGCSIGNIKENRAESKYYEVVAASIIARYYALMQVRDLERKAGFFIPLGSTHVSSALLEIKKKSLNPKDYVKMKFKNVEEFFQ